MAITPRKLVQCLEAADQKLQEVRQQLIRCESLDAQVIPLLTQVVETLNVLKSERELISGSELAQQLAKDIQARAKRADALLKSAAELICHSALTRPLIEGAYTPDGEFPSIEFSGRMIVHA